MSCILPEDTIQHPAARPDKVLRSGASLLMHTPDHDALARDLPRLRRLLQQRLSLSDVRAICFDCNVEYDDLPGAGGGDKIIALLDTCKRTRQLRELLRIIGELREDLQPLLYPTPPPAGAEGDEPDPSAQSLTSQEAVDRILKRTSPPFASRVRPMVEFYQEVFGGRDAELGKLDAWLDDGRSPTPSSTPRPGAAKPPF